jgi:hypothetical protein
MTAPIAFGCVPVVPVANELLVRFAQINVHALRPYDQHCRRAQPPDRRVGALPDSTLVATKVADIRRLVYGSPRYFAARGVPKTPDDLADYAGGGSRPWRLG